MKLKVGLITRDEALAISPDYVAFVEGNFDKYPPVEEKFSKLKVRQNVIVYHNGQFVRAKVTSMNSNDIRAVDGPIVRVSNGEYSWRVDGSGYAWPV